MGGHGDHWQAVYDDLDRFGTERLPALCEQLPEVCRLPWTDAAAIPDGVQADSLFVLSEGGGALQHMVLLMGESAAQTCALITAYPVVSAGIAHDVTISEVLAWPCGAEGQIRGRIAGGVEIAFFDPLFFRNRHRYRVGERQRFSLAAIAYRVERPQQTDTVIDDAEAVARHRRTGPGGRGPVALALRGGAILLSQPGGRIDDYAFRGPVKACAVASFDGRALYRLRVTLMRPDGRDFDLPLLALAHTVADGWLPAPGDDITGALWLQGTLAEADGEAA